jgi:arylsulfatase A-like enzyme
MLREGGYKTALVGKWHLGWLPKYGPLQSGYDEFWGFRSGAVDYFRHSGDLWENDTKISRSGYLTDLLGDKAVSLIRDYAARKSPFFLSLHFSAPHWPWEAPGSEAESKNLRNLFHWDGGSQDTYRRMVQRMDYQIGRVLNALKAGGIAGNTIVVFTSDNGGERFSDTWPFTGKKTELLEGGLRVPTIVRWPTRVRPGRTTDQVAITMDWVPTLLKLAGRNAHNSYQLDGVDLSSFLTSDNTPVRRKLFWRYRQNSQGAVRDGNMKWLKIGDNTFLFDVAADPLERANLKAKQPVTFEKLSRSWQDWERTMLPEDPEAFTHGFRSSQLADHYGTSAK